MGWGVEINVNEWSEIDCCVVSLPLSTIDIRWIINNCKKL